MRVRACDMKELLRSLQQRFLAGRLRDEFSEPVGEPDWEKKIEERARRYHDVMLERIARFSEQNKGFIQVPDTLYHSSVYSNLPFLDPEIGQGLGVWFQDDLSSAAEIGVFRCLDPLTGTPYPNTCPSIYEATLNVKSFAIFPDEGALYQMAIQEPEDDDDLKFKPQEFYDLHNIRRALVGAGYDGIYLLREETFSALDSQAITIIREHDPYEIYNRDSGPQDFSITAEPGEFIPE